MTHNDPEWLTMTQDDIPGVMGAPGGPGGRQGAPGGSRLPPAPKREIKQQNNDPKSWFKVGVEQILAILAEFTGISFLNRRQTLQLFLWFGIGMIWSPHSKILCYTTGSHFNNFSISEIILIFALWFSSISNSNSKILNRKVKPSDQKQRVASRNQEFCSAKILVFLQTLPAFDFRD